jgi:hypothetical protein
MLDCQTHCHADRILGGIACDQVMNVMSVISVTPTLTMRLNGTSVVITLLAHVQTSLMSIYLGVDAWEQYQRRNQIIVCGAVRAAQHSDGSTHPWHKHQNISMYESGQATNISFSYAQRVHDKLHPINTVPRVHFDYRITTKHSRSKSAAAP